ncbi:DUF4142 domain-containing protein [Roseomonas xinghualingensis]|uniref:DUF4142 domain-containing protein n=1 Tax=Roseomonas xinghualingensis TaxID=2986475 RepID=UPI0021F18CB6|nr:DUF4142 domain-containing protein [Roseomonas sp. SXEYE001]MCV4208954.1 DUF4142 domain-containing protein [Roseomonas sp. SXEYE001]
MMNRRALSIILAGSTLAGCAATAQSNMASQSAVGGDLTGLRLQALQGGAFLMQTAQLGASKAQRPELRRFAPFEVSEQQGLVQAMGLVGSSATPPALTGEKAAMLQRLQTASGPEFDRMFVIAQIQGHREALPVYVAILQNNAAPAADRAIALLAADRIREHLAYLEAISSRA